MICKKCGTESDDGNIFCPKCGNKLKRKKGKGVLRVILLLAIVCGVGIALHMSGYDRNIAVRFGWIADETAVETLETERDSQEAILTEQEKSQKAEMEDTAEETTEMSDEQEQFLEKLSFDPIEMTMGETYQVELERKIEDAVWKSSDETVVKVSEGQLKAIMPGTATVTFWAGEKELDFEVMVNNFPDMTLAVNCSKRMEINDAFSDIIWESSMPEIVSVEDGTIRSLESGASTITAYIDGNPYSFEVVATTPDITTVSVRKIIGNTEQVSILGTNGKAEWKSDNTAIATVSDTGLITAEPTGAGQSTVVHAYIDGMEFKIDVAVEPIPQLSSTYKFYGYEENNVSNYTANVTICANADETVTVSPEKSRYDQDFSVVDNVLNVADADYSKGDVFPLYRSFRMRGSEKDIAAKPHADIYLVGTSQEADVMIQQLDSLASDGDYDTHVVDTVIYEACEDYGIIHVYRDDDHGLDGMRLVTVSVDGYDYQFAVGGISSEMSVFSYGNIDKLSPKYMVEECLVDEMEVPEHVNLNQSAIVSNSKTFNPGSDWVERIGTKFIESVEDQAIEMAAGALLKFIFL